MSLFKQYETDKVKETKGVRHVLAIENGKEVAVIIARMSKSNPHYQSALARITKPHTRQLQLKTLSEETMEAFLLEAFAETILLGWENMPDKAGNILQYSKENVIEQMTALPDLYDELNAKANDISLFRLDEMEETAKN